MPPKIPEYSGRRRSGKICTINVKHLARMPAQPNPAIARPSTNILDVAALAHSRLPDKKMAIEASITRLTEKILYSLPKKN